MKRSRVMSLFVLLLACLLPLVNGHGGDDEGHGGWDKVGFCKIGTDPSCSGSGSVSLGLRIVLIIVHFASYPVIFYSMYVTLQRQANLLQKGASIFLLFMAFASEIINTDYFISDHINVQWYATFEYSVISMFGFWGVVIAQTFLAFGFQSKAQKRRMNRHKWRKYLEYSLNSILLIMCACEPLFYYKCRVLNLLSTIVSGIIASYRMYLCLGKFTIKYCLLYSVGGAIGGIASVLTVELCIQWIHVIAASAFAFSGSMVAKAILDFKSDDEETEDSSSGQRSASPGSVEYTAVIS